MFIVEPSVKYCERGVESGVERCVERCVEGGVEVEETIGKHGGTWSRVVNRRRERGQHNSQCRCT